MTSQLITVVKPLTVTTVNNNNFIVSPGQQATVKWDGWSPISGGGFYRLSGAMHNADGRRLRCWPGYEPTVRVDRLHRAVAHAEPLFRYCDRCHGTGRNLAQHNYGTRRALDGPHCKACTGTGHTKVYPATGALQPAA